MDYIFLLLGFVLLIKGADFFVEGASSIAKTLKVPALIIGLTIVAFGTSAPELAVSITSAMKGQNGIAVGNVVGSNIFNILMVIGVSAILCPLAVKKSILIKEFPFTILAGIALFIMAIDTVLGSGQVNMLSRTDGLMLLIFFGIFMYYLIEVALQARASGEDEEIEGMPLWKSIVFSIGGIAGIVWGGDVVVDSATNIALAWGMSETLVGLTIIAVGTSLPELVTSIVAARKGESDIALGNVIGSCIFNVFLILGVSAIINPIELSGAIFTDMFIMVVITFVTYIFSLSKRISRVEGGILVASYVAYMAYIIMR
ncbi:MAG: calcium/sodium antiporter [Niameybacter sp.]|uniref:calcium/sodium antiporter n=1 Tax=Niameybacter sp. TaxID=2033640 RepID=UPI002FC7AB69